MAPRPGRVAALAAVCAAAVVALWLAANDLAAGRALDAGLGDELHGLDCDATANLLLKGAESLADTLPFAVGAILLVGLAWLRGPRVLALWTALVLIVANGVTQLAQPALTSARHVDLGGTTIGGSGSWPSGHATAAMTLALCAVVVAGPRLRAVTALVGLGYALGVGGALVALGGHLPSDAAGAYLVAGAFVAAGHALYGALVGESEPDSRAARSPAVAPALGALAGAAFFTIAAAQAAVTRRDEVARAIGDVPFVLAAIGGLTAAVLIAAAIVLRRAR
jgi:membrane-associated phospholipid phosphatase